MNVFQNHSLYNANLTEGESIENDNKINEAINIAFAKKGPTHINAPFEEPLYQTVRKMTVDPTISAFSKVYKTISIDDIIAYTNIWNSAKKKLILIGVNEPNEIDADIIAALASDPSILVLTENTSNIHHPTFLGNRCSFVPWHKFICCANSSTLIRALSLKSLFLVFSRCSRIKAKLKSFTFAS